MEKESWADGLCRRLLEVPAVQREGYVFHIPLGLKMWNKVKADPNHFLHKYLVQAEDKHNTK